MATPPCKVNGIDCPDRHVGCQAECPQYKAFRVILDESAKIRRINAMCADYASDQILKSKHTLRYTVDGRRALAQR